MQPFAPLSSRLIPLERAHVDTDQIIPKQYLKGTGRGGLGRGLFHDWRYRADGASEPAFVLNRPEYQGARLLVAEENFGCGSSREHAVWALLDWGIAAVLAPSFGDIFYNNACKSGLLPVRVPAATARRLLLRAAHPHGVHLGLDLATQTVRDRERWQYRFAIDPFRKQCLLEGWDEIALTLRHADAIAAFERLRPPTP